MAQAKSLFAEGMTGQVGKQFVYKQYYNKTIVAKYPDMSNIKPTKLQESKRSVFAIAVAYAKAIINDPVTKAKYQKKVRKGQSVYHYALREYLTKQKSDQS